MNLPLTRSESSLVSLGAGAMTFLVFFAGHLIFARIVETTEPHSALWAVVGSAGVGLWAVSFMASTLALARIDVARGAPVWGKVLLIASCGALCMTVPPTAASTILTHWNGSPPVSWSSVLDRLSSGFLTALLALSPFVLLVGLRLVRERRSASI
jgi:hypothetical protein